MSAQIPKSSRCFPILAAMLLPLFGCLISAAIIYWQFQGLPGALGRMSLDNLTQVVVPGSKEIHFSKKGAYAVYYEYRSVVNGVSYINSKTPPREDYRQYSRRVPRFNFILGLMGSCSGRNLSS